MPPRFSRTPIELLGAQAYNIEEARRAVGCGVRPIREAIRRRELKVNILAGRQIITAENLAAWLRSLPETSDADVDGEAPS